MTESKKKRLPPKMKNGERMIPNKVYKSDNPKKKKMVYAIKDGVGKKINFGDATMSDFTKHKSKKRQKNYLARSGGIKNKSGELTKNDRHSANYWSRRILWSLCPLIFCGISYIYT